MTASLDESKSVIWVPQPSSTIIWRGKPLMCRWGAAEWILMHLTVLWGIRQGVIHSLCSGSWFLWDRSVPRVSPQTLPLAIRLCSPPFSFSLLLLCHSPIQCFMCIQMERRGLVKSATSSSTSSRTLHPHPSWLPTKGPGASFFSHPSLGFSCTPLSRKWKWLTFWLHSASISP